MSVSQTRRSGKGGVWAAWQLVAMIRLDKLQSAMSATSFMVTVVLSQRLVVSRCGAGLTLSKEQLAEASARVKAAGLEDQVTLLFCDYRDCQGGGHGRRGASSSGTVHALTPSLLSLLCSSSPLALVQPVCAARPHPQRTALSS